MPGSPRRTAPNASTRRSRRPIEAGVELEPDLLADALGFDTHDIAIASIRNSPQPLVSELCLRRSASIGGPGSATSIRRRLSITTRRTISCEGSRSACLTAFETTSDVSSSASDTTEPGKPDPIAATAALARMGAIGSGGSRSSISDLMVSTSLGTRSRLYPTARPLHPVGPGARRERRVLRLERPRDDLARGLVRADHDTRGGDRAVDELQTGGDRSVREQALARSEDDGEQPQAVLVD